MRTARLVRRLRVVQRRFSCARLTAGLPFSGVYGDVQRVKILFNKKDNALVQMLEPHQASVGEC